MTNDKRPREWTKFGIGSHWVFVDVEDLPILSRFTWHVTKSKNTFYAQTNVRIAGKNYLLSMHRLLTGIRAGLVDHKNRIGLDNRKDNLRFATAKENSYNRVRKNRLGFRGVYQRRGESTFCCQIQKDGKRIHRFGFETAEDAAREYDKLNKELHGEFGVRNFKD